MKLTTDQLVSQLSTNLDPSLAQAAVESYVEMQQRFLAGDWKPTELDGGRLCEAVSRCLLQLDTGVVNHAALPAAIRNVLLDKSKTHQVSQKDREHLAKVIELVYKFRSDRGAVHISPIHTANQMDSMLIVHAGKWILSELLRLAWNHDPRVVGEVIGQIVQLEHSMIHELDGKPLVLSTDVSTPEEVLLLLNHAPSNQLAKSTLRAYMTHRKSSAANMAISRLLQSKEIREAANGDLALTPKGQKRVLEDIVPKHNPTS